MVVDTGLFAVYHKFLQVGWRDVFINSALAMFSVFVCRLFGNIYGQIWRYGGIQCYIRLVITDGVATFLFFVLEYSLNKPLRFTRLLFVMIIALMTVDLLLVLVMRMSYRYCFKCGNSVSARGKLLRFLLKVFAGVTVDKADDSSKIKIAIVGAGNAGVSFAEDLLNNAGSPYVPRMFIDDNDSKVGRQIHDIPVFPRNEGLSETIREYKIQEIVIAIPSVTPDKRKELYDYYKRFGCKLKTYDYPSVQTVGANQVFVNLILKICFSENKFKLVMKRLKHTLVKR